jgi:mono/diheme cytochrome c family protein
MTFSARRLACLILLSAWLAADASTVAAPHVPAYQRFHQAGEQPLQAGQLLLGELNCLACHQTSDDWASQISSKQAPILDQVGSRVRPEFIRAYLSDPQKARPGSTMPDMLVGLPAAERKQAIEFLTHFLASTGSLNDTPAMPANVVQGDRLFHELGCTACHDPRQEGQQPLASSVVLPQMSDKYTIPALASFLKNPLAVRPSGRMPSLNLSDQEAQQVASYLLKDLQLPANTRFAYYEGSWDTLPDFSTLEPKAEGEGFGFDLGVAARREKFGMQFRATLVIPKSGTYKLHLGSDDGSRLLLDGQEVVRVDGVHPLQFKSANLELTAGEHPLLVEFFEQAGEEVLRVEIEGNGLKRQPLDQLLKTPKPEPTAETTPFELNPEFAANGAMLFVSLNCNACHQLKREGLPQPERPLAGALKELDTAQGCLAPAPTRDGPAVPSYALSAPQRRDLAAALARIRQGAAAELAGTTLIANTLERFNCYACHQRGEIGGVEQDRNEQFRTTEKEMGDEARIPPLLTGVGSKLRKEWMDQVFENGAKDRPYMLTRMPRFSKQNLGPLSDLLASHDKLQPLAAVDEKFSNRQLKAAGRRMVGAGGYSCIKCHTYGAHKATGVQSISLTTMHKRLQPEWFRQYVVKPLRFRPGTRMPTAWPDGQVLLDKILDGTIDQQVHAVWTFLADGDKGAMPAGLGPEPIELVAVEHAIIYRNFIEGAGSRAIGVGYAEKANLAFDANEMSLSLLWHGAFIDASRHWKGRGQGYQGPLGDNVLRLESRPALAVLENAEVSWPTDPARQLGYRFRGYRLVEGQKPVFRYDYRQVQVEDFFDPTSDKDFTPLNRTLRLTSKEPLENLWIRAIVAETVEQKDGELLIDGDWLLKVSGHVGQAVLRKQGNRTEVLLPVEWQKTATGTFFAQIQELFNW